MDSILQFLSDNLGMITASVFGVSVVSVYLSKVLTILKELSEVLNALVAGLSDGKLTKEELDLIVKEGKDVGEAVRQAFKKGK